MELLLTKFKSQERVLSKEEVARPAGYIQRMVKFSKGFIEFINEEALEMKLTDTFFDQMDRWNKQYSDIDELDHSDENLEEQGILIDEEESISFDGRLTYSRFYKIVSDEGESMNDPKLWAFNDKKIEHYHQIDFSQKNSAAFSSHLFLLKFYVLRKIDEVAFVTSRFVHCPKCGANYVIPSTKIEFQQTYKCEQRVGDKECGTTLKKFPARKMIPTYIYEIAVEVRSSEGVELKEFFLESFTELHPGYYTGMVFGRTENKSNSFYFMCLTVREEKSKIPFQIISSERHGFHNFLDSVYKHIQKVGFVIDEEKARLVLAVESLKKLILIMNKEMTIDHSLYFGAPGIGKTYALTLLHHMFYSNSGFISGPRFTLAGLTGGQKEIFYQDTSRKKNVPGLFSAQAFIFDEVNNQQFLGDNKATNLLKSCALSPSGTSATVGGKEFPRISLIAGTGNYDIDKLKHYENKILRLYNQDVKGNTKQVSDQDQFLSKIMSQTAEKDKNYVPEDFDFYAPIKDFHLDVPKELRNAVLKIRDDSGNYLTTFSKPLMERFYWSILVHPRYDKAYVKAKEIDVFSHMKARHSVFSQRELISHLFVPEMNLTIERYTKDVRKEFEDKEVERKWSKQVQEFLTQLAGKHKEFFAMFKRIEQVHVFALYTLSVMNHETELSYETKRIYERLVSLLHTPIKIEDFHTPDYENYRYIGESRVDFMRWLKRHPEEDVRQILDMSRRNAKKLLVELENNGKIKKIDDYHYSLKAAPKMEDI